MTLRHSTVRERLTPGWRPNKYDLARLERAEAKRRRKAQANMRHPVALQ